MACLRGLPGKPEYVEVDQKADGDSNGVFFNRRQTLKHLVQLLELSSGITQRAETQELPVRDGILTHFHFQTDFL